MPAFTYDLLKERSRYLSAFKNEDGTFSITKKKNEFAYKQLWKNVSKIENDHISNAFHNPFFYEYKDGPLGYVDKKISRLLLKEIEIPNSIKAIPRDCFMNQSTLETVILPKKLKEIREYAFTGCEALKDITFLSPLTTIYNNVFHGCTNLETITLPSSLTTIPENLFLNCTSLKTIIIPESVKRIETKAFIGCSNLESITIPNSVHTIKNNVFTSCSKLKEVKLPKIKEIPTALFEDCTSLENVVIPNSVETISMFAFKGCKNLKSLSLPISITKIEPRAFSGCASLDNITLPNITVIYDGLFYNCSSLKNITLPNSTLKINENAFENCVNLKNIIFPDSIQSISSAAFKDCVSLETISLPKIDHIAPNMFENCVNLKTVIMPDTVENIQHNAFINCTNLTSITLSNKLSLIHSSAFKNCINLKEINIPNDVFEIGVSGFENCTSLKNIHLPSGMYSIATNLFKNCTSLEEVTLPETLKVIAIGAFENCVNLKTLRIPSSVRTIYETAFLNCKFNFIAKNNDGSIDLYQEKPSELSDTKEVYDISLLQQSFMNLSIADLIKNPDSIKEYGALAQLVQSKKGQLPFKFVKELTETTNGLSYLKESDFKWINQIKTMWKEQITSYPEEHWNDFHKFGLALGIFKPSYVNEEGKTVNPAQKAVEFLKERIKTGELKIQQIHSKFHAMNIRGYHKDFANFVLDKNNFSLLMNSNDNELITNIYHNYEDAVKTFYTTPEHGVPRKLKPTVELFEDYFRRYKFAGTNEENADIAFELAKFSGNRQEHFQRALSIKEEIIDKKINKHILGEELKELNIYKQIEYYKNRTEELKQEAVNNSADTLEMLADLANRNFTYEWLSKHDPKNYNLGQYCSCCAHLAGAGYGIMRASMIHPDVQNLVIKDDSGKIVAKSTLYVNRKEGYGVCNNVEVNDMTFDKEAIYKKFKKAIRDFALKYNEIFTKTPLTQINVGMNLNDLGNQIKSNDSESTILTGIKFGEFGLRNQDYMGDWAKGQYEIWNIEKERNNENER